MKEENFKRFYKKEKNLKNLKEAEEKIELFWAALMEALKRNEKVIFKNWGKFEIKEVKSRKVKIPNKEFFFNTLPKKVMIFRCGKGLRERINKIGEDSDE